MINDTEINSTTKDFSLEYKWLEYRLIINKELYDAKIIDLKTFTKMEERLLARLTKTMKGSVTY